MRIKICLCLVFSFSLGNLVFGQSELSGFHLESRKKADNLIDKLVQYGHFDFSPYALLASNNTYYLIILDRKTHYSMAWLELNVHGEIKIEKIENRNKSNQIIDRIFEFNQYHKDFISFDSDFYKNGYDLASAKNGHSIPLKTD